MEIGKGGASRPRPHFWPAGRSRPSRVESMRQPGRALVGHQERPAASAFVPLPFAPLRSRSRPLSRSRSSSSSSAARHRRRRSELLSLLATAFSLPSAATDGSASSCHTPCSHSTALGESRASGRAHRSESELRRPLGPHGSPSPLRHYLRR